MNPLFSTDARAKLIALDRSQAVAEFDLTGIILSANANFLKTFGYRLEEIKGRHHEMLVTPADRDSPRYRQFWADLASGRFQQAEFKRLAKGGREVWIQASYNPIVGLNGRPVKIVKFATDVTAETLRNIDCAGQINALHRSQAVIELALDGTILTANENFLRAFGYALEEVVGRSHSIFVDARDRTGEEYRRFWEGLSRGEYQSGEFQRIGKNGERIYIQASYNPIFDGDGKPLKIVKFATDITKQVQDRLRRTELQRTVRQDLNDIADATSDVAKQATTAALSAESVLNDVQVMISGANQMIASADSISQQVAEAASVSERAFTQVEESAETMSSVSSHAACIRDVISLIQRVATQINLLALNATIEAARAGDAGRGFSVVAQEVKTLADQTRHSAEQIQAQVSAMLGATNRAGATITSIRQTVQLLNDVSRTIGSAVDDQTFFRHQMASGMTTVSESAHAITASMQMIAKAAESADTSTQKVRIASQAMV